MYSARLVDSSGATWYGKYFINLVGLVDVSRPAFSYLNKLSSSFISEQVLYYFVSISDIFMKDLP